MNDVIFNDLWFCEIKVDKDKKTVSAGNDIKGSSVNQYNVPNNCQNTDCIQEKGLLLQKNEYLSRENSRLKEEINNYE